MPAAAAAVPEAGPESLSPLQKAAVFLMYLDHEAARAVLRQLADEDVKRVAGAISEMGEVDPAHVGNVVVDFVDELRSVSVMPTTGRDFASKVLPDLVDANRRDRITKTIRRRDAGRDFESFIQGKPPAAVAAVLREEHPQLSAVALLRMGPTNAAKVLNNLPIDDQPEIAIRMARTKHVDAELAEEVERSLRTALADLEDPMSLGGVEPTAKILGRMQREQNVILLQTIRDRGDSLADDLERRMMSFEDLIRLDGRAVQQVLRVAERSDLSLALRGASPEMKDLVFRNLSSRAAEDLKEELNSGAPPRRVQVREAQDRLVAVVRKLADEGVIDLDSGDEEGAG